MKGFQPTQVINNKSKKSNQQKNKKSQKNKSNGIKIIPTESPLSFDELPVATTTTAKTRIIDHYSHSNSYYEESHGSRKRRYVDIQFIKNG